MDAEGGISIHRNRFNRCQGTPTPSSIKNIKTKTFQNSEFGGKKEASSVKKNNKRTEELT